MAARQTLTLFVRVQILLPQSKKKAVFKTAFFFGMMFSFGKIMLASPDAVWLRHNLGKHRIIANGVSTSL